MRGEQSVHRSRASRRAFLQFTTCCKKTLPQRHWHQKEDSAEQTGPGKQREAELARLPADQPRVGFWSKAQTEQLTDAPDTRPLARVTKVVVCVGRKQSMQIMIAIVRANVHLGLTVFQALF